MVENRHVRIVRGALFGRNPHQMGDRLIGHRRMRAQRNEVVEPGHPPPKLLVEQAKQQRDRGRARTVGDDHQHPLAVRGQPVQSPRQQLPYRILAQCGRCGPLPCDHRLSSIKCCVLSAAGSCYTPLKALKPPSTATTTPLTKLAPGPQSQISVLTSSSGSPKRPAGVWSTTSCPRGVSEPSSLSSSARFWSPMKKPGAMAFTRKRPPKERASSTANQRVAFSTPALAMP